MGNFIEEKEFNQSEVISKLILEMNEKGQIRFKMLDKDDMLISHPDNEDFRQKQFQILISIYSFLKIFDNYHWKDIDMAKSFTVIQE